MKAKQYTVEGNNIGTDLYTAGFKDPNYGGYILFPLTTQPDISFGLVNINRKYAARTLRDMRNAAKQMGVKVKSRVVGSDW